MLWEGDLDYRGLPRTVWSGLCLSAAGVRSSVGNLFDSWSLRDCHHNPGVSSLGLSPRTTTAQFCVTFTLPSPSVYLLMAPLSLLGELVKEIPRKTPVWTPVGSFWELPDSGSFLISEPKMWNAHKEDFRKAPPLPSGAPCAPAELLKSVYTLGP